MSSHQGWPHATWLIEPEINPHYQEQQAYQGPAHNYKLITQPIKLYHFNRVLEITIISIQSPAPHAWVLPQPDTKVTQGRGSPALQAPNYTSKHPQSLGRA